MYKENQGSSATPPTYSRVALSGGVAAIHSKTANILVLGLCYYYFFLSFKASFLLLIN